MESCPLAISLAILGLLAWDVARRFFALQSSKLATADAVVLLEQRMTQLASLIGNVKNDLADRVDALQADTASDAKVSEIRSETDANIRQLSDDAEKMGKRVGELDDKMAKIISGTVQKGPRKMILGGIR